MFANSFTLVALSLALPSLVSAHGFVSQITANGQTYSAGKPNAGEGPVRQVNTVGPVATTGDAVLSCGYGAHPVSESAHASPGSEISFLWSGGGGNHWPHEVGPLMTYMAACNGPCASFDSANAQWFKIAEAGVNNGRWAQKDIKEGKPISATIPSDLASGEYLIRSEVIALHNAQSPGGAEFYPSCTQLKIDGNGSAKPNPTVTFPGGYSPSDPGLVYDAYTPGGRDYTFPGPPMANLKRRSERALRFARNL